MGDINQLIYLKKHFPKVSDESSILEIGSRDYGNTSSFRSFYQNSAYVGIDMLEGKDVDHVLDLTKGIAPLSSESFDLVICCSVLEHVRQPWVMAENISKLMKTGGTLYISVPWVWRYHAYPDDYFRFSWKGIIELFPNHDWRNIYYSTNIENEFYEITEETKKIDSKLGLRKRTLFKGKRKYLPSLMVNMLGTKGCSIQT